MAKITGRLVERTQIAQGTLSIGLELEGGALAFQPGQFIRLGLIDPPRPDPKGHVRSFSIASAPGDARLMIATRMTGSPYKTSLAEVPLGTSVTVNGPGGKFLLDPNPEVPAVLFAGGIGITPFRSMIKYALEREQARRLTLVYANRCPEQAAFLEELEAWAGAGGMFRLLATMTQPEASARPWGGLTGYVDAAFVRAHVPELPTCYVAGPPGFVGAVTQALREAGVGPEKIRSDEFIGYN
jgi:ferredoxin-NADP reductase